MSSSIYLLFIPLHLPIYLLIYLFIYLLLFIAYSQLRFSNPFIILCQCQHHEVGSCYVDHRTPMRQYDQVGPQHCLTKCEHRKQIAGVPPPPPPGAKIADLEYHFSQVVSYTQYTAVITQ